MDYRISGERMTGIADAIRAKTGDAGTMTPPQMIDEINGIRLGIPVTITCHTNEQTGEWERPAEWPDLDTIDCSTGDDCLYATYDCSKTPGYGWVGFYGLTTDSSAWTIERGTLSNGVFTASETYSVNSNAFFRHPLDSSLGTIQLWRARSSAGFKELGFCSNSDTSAECLYCQLQPCVETAGRLQHLTTLSGRTRNYAAYTNNARSHCTFWQEREKIYVSGTFTSLQNTWSSAVNLQSLDVSHWDTSHAVVKVLSTCFDSCCSLRTIDLSHWDTSGWKVTALSSCWTGCISLTELDLSSWDTSGWSVTSLSSCWYNCCSLQHLNVSGWNTTAWEVTTMASCWAECFSLQTLDLSDWNTSNWVVAPLNSCWHNNWSLQSLDLNGWDTSNWSVTSIALCWENCYSLKSLLIDRWNTSNWVTTTIQGCWSNCFSLKSLDLSKWDTSTWNVTSLQGAIYRCYSLTYLNVTNLVGSNFTGNASTLFAHCYSLREIIGLNTWDISGLKNINAMFQECRSIQRLDLSSWHNSQATSVQLFVGNCFGLRYLDVSGLDCSSVTTFDRSLYYTFNLEYFSGYPGLKVAQDVSLPNLTRESLLDIIDNLPTVTGTVKITLSNNARKLTASELAVATEKGWTIV